MRNDTHVAHRPKATKMRPQRSDSRVGTWTRKQLLQMDRQFCSVMRRATGQPPSPPSPLEHLEHLLKNYQRRCSRRARRAA